MTTKAAAHILTSDAVPFGDPVIVVMTPDEGMGAEVIEERPLPADRGFTTARAILTELMGWRITGETTEVAVGYTITPVERY